MSECAVNDGLEFVILEVYGEDTTLWVLDRSLPECTTIRKVNGVLVLGQH